MKCKQVQLNIDDYVDGYLKNPSRDVLEKHLAECNFCQRRFQARSTMVAQLNDLPALAGPSPKLLAQVLLSRRRLEANTKSQRHKRFVLGTATSLAASVVIGFAISMYIGTLPTDIATNVSAKQDAAGINKGRHQILTVLFNSKAALGDVKFSVIPPESVDIEGFVGERVVAWNGKLRKGENLLKIPLILNGFPANEPSKLRVSIEHNREKRQFSVTLDAARLRPAST